jgi:hypothetical protein
MAVWNAARQGRWQQHKMPEKVRFTIFNRILLFEYQKNKLKKNACANAMLPIVECVYKEAAVFFVYHFV